MLKPALLALVAGSLVSSSPYAPDEPRIDMNAIARIDCGGFSGTAFWITRTRIVTAVHVIAAAQPCSIAGHVLSTVRSGNRDLAEVRGLENDHYLRVDCGGFREGRVYHATGYALGDYRHTARLLATRDEEGDRDGPPNAGERILLGAVYPGMSGGPVVDGHGHVVGIVNRSITSPPMAESRALADSFICGGEQ